MCSDVSLKQLVSSELEHLARRRQDASRGYLFVFCFLRLFLCLLYCRAEYMDEDLRRSGLIPACGGGERGRGHWSSDHVKLQTLAACMFSYYGM